MDREPLQVPEDEPWGVWHRAASEQVANVVSMLTSDPLPVLARGRDFAQRALRVANPLEEIFTKALVKGIDDVEVKISGKERSFVLTESVMTHMLADIDQIVGEMQINLGQHDMETWVLMLSAAVQGEAYGAPPFEGVEDGSVRG